MRNVTVCTAVSLILAGCGGGGGGEAPSSPTNVSTQSVSKQPNIAISVTRSEINQTQVSTLTWSVTDATNCTGSGAWSGSQSLTGSKYVTYVDGAQTFDLSCTGSGGTVSRSVTVTGKQPTLTFAGAWYPVVAQSIKNGYDGTIVGSFYNQIKIGSQQKNGLAVTGWGYKGWDSTSNETAIVKMALFEPDDNGLLTLATNKYITDASTYGGASVIVTDINNDNYQDIISIPHNETPILPKPTTVFYGSSNGSFSKKITSNQLAAHDARLVTVDGKSKIFTSVVTGHPRNAYYEFSNGDLVPTYTPNISYYNSNFVLFGNMSQTVVQNKNGNKSLVTAGGCRQTIGTCDYTINVFPYNGNDISQTVPTQTITPYLTNMPTLTNVSSFYGQGQTHVYRVWAEDFNNDGNTDILAEQTMWSQNGTTFAATLQVLQNQGNNTFADKTDTLNGDMPTDLSNALDDTPTFVDVDNSGIKTLFFTNITFSNTKKHSNYVMLNDGTGKLYVAIHDEFVNITDKIFSLLIDKGYQFPISNPTSSWMLPKFIAVPQTNGTVNFLAEVPLTSVNPENGISQNARTYVNVPFSYNPTTDYIKNVTINDRNNSTKIRTWAGDDAITDKNAVLGTKIDGGLGKNKVVYSNVSSNYTITKNSDGSYRVINITNNIDDTLIRIQSVVFSDKTITLE